MSRELSRRRRSPERRNAPLSDIGRLPLEAAVDMVCAGIDAMPNLPGGGHRGGKGPLPELVERIEETGHAEPQRAAAAAARVLGAGARVGGLGGGAVDAIQRLALVALRGGDAATLARLTAALLAEPLQLGTALLGPLVQRCRQDAGARIVVIEAARLWLAQTDRVWREHDGADAIDGLMSSLVEQGVARADLDEAVAAAFLWPPMRTALRRLGSALAGAGRVRDLDRLVQPYKRRGALFNALVEVVTTVAASQGHRGEELAAWLFALQPDAASFDLARTTTHPRLWRARRAALIGRVLDTDDAPWLVPLLLGEADAEDVLIQLTRDHVRRDATVVAALAALQDMHPKRAFDEACAALLRWATGAPSRSGQHARELAAQSHAQAIQRAAAALGQPALADAWLGLARRELADVAPALRRVL